MYYTTQIYNQTPGRLLASINILPDMLYQKFDGDFDNWHVYSHYKKTKNFARTRKLLQIALIQLVLEYPSLFYYLTLSYQAKCNFTQTIPNFCKLFHHLKISPILNLKNKHPTSTKLIKPKKLNKPLNFTEFLPQLHKTCSNIFHPQSTLPTLPSLNTQTHPQ